MNFSVSEEKAFLNHPNHHVPVIWTLLLFHYGYFLVLLPSLGSAQFGSVLARDFGQKARLGSLSFSKSSGLKNSANTSFLKNFEKNHWQSTVLMGKFQFFSLHNVSRRPFSAKRLIKNVKNLSKMAQI